MNARRNRGTAMDIRMSATIAVRIKTPIFIYFLSAGLVSEIEARWNGRPPTAGESFTLSRRLPLGCACARTHCIGPVRGIEPRFTKCDFQSRFQISQYAERFGNCLF